MSDSSSTPVIGLKWAPRQLAWIFALGGGAEVLLVWHLGASSVLPAFLYLGAVLAVSTRRLPNLLVLSSYPIALILLGPAAYIDGAWWPEMEVVTRELVPSGL